MRFSKSTLAIAMVLVMFVAAVLLAAIGGEIYVRLKSPYGYVTPEILRSRRPLYGAAVFARHVFPRREHVVRDKDGKELYSINALGYRGAPFSPHKPQGTVRIMIYGGSSVFDHDNPGARDWPHRVETRLRQSGFPAVEVINAGIPGHASSDSVGRLFAEGHLFNPDYVLYYGEWNDIKDFRETDPLLRYRIPTRSEENDPLFFYQNPIDRWLCDVSQLYVRLRERYYTWNFRIGSEGVLPEGSYASTLSETALRQYRLNVQTFVDVARNVGAVPVLVTEARLVSRKNEDADKKRINYEFVLLTHEGLNHAFEEEDRILREISNEKQVHLTDSSAALSGRSEFFLDAVHLTDRGSDALSDIVATSIATLLNNPTRPAANRPAIQAPKSEHPTSR